MTKPDKIWAVFKEYRNPKDKVPEVYASASPTKGDEFLLSTPAREHAEELVNALVDIILNTKEDEGGVYAEQVAYAALRNAGIVNEIKEQTDE